jgi:hypothetical protein
MVCIASLLIFAACGKDKDFGNELPPGFPTDIPLIEGQLEDSRSTLFDDGKGFVIGIRSPLSMEESVSFYKEAFKNNSEPAVFSALIQTSDPSQKVVSIDVQRGTMYLLMEIVSGSETTYVNISVHLKK